MASSSSTTREIANAWASFYNQYYNVLGGGNESGPRSKIDAARKEWCTILNKLRGGNVRHWPTEPDEIRQIQQLLQWGQCDMWSTIDGVSARDHIRSATSHPAYTSFQGWASEVKVRRDAQKSVGAKTPLPKVQPQREKPKADGSEHLLGLSNPFLVPFSPLYEELNGSLDSAERKHFAVMKSVERQCEFYSMAHEYTANVKNELQEVRDEPGRKELYQRYASSLLILATKLYDEWTKDVMDWKATTDTDDDSEASDDNDDGSDDDDNDDSDDDDEGETDTDTDSLAPIVKITDIGTKEAAPSPHRTSANNAEISNRDNDAAKANLNPSQTIPSSFASDMNRPPLQIPTTRERQPEAPKARSDLEVQSDPDGEHGDPWSPGIFRSVYFPSTQSADSTATFENQGQEPGRPHLQRPSPNGKQSGGFDAHKESRKGGLETPSGSLHSPRPAMDAKSLLSKEDIYPAWHPDLSDKERKRKDTLQPQSSPLPPTRTGTSSMGKKSSLSNSMHKAEPVAIPKVVIRTFQPASPVYPGVPQMKQASRPDPRPRQTSQTLFSPLPSLRRVHHREHPSGEASLLAQNSSIGNIYRPPFQRAASGSNESTASASSRAVPKSPPLHDPREIIDQGENIRRLSADGVMMRRFELMEEGRAGYDSQDFIQNEGKKVIQASAKGSNDHDTENISDVSSIDMTESEDEQSDTPAPSKLTPVVVKCVPKVDMNPPRTTRLVSGILRGAGTRPNTPTHQRSVQFRNSPQVRYI